MRRGDVRWAWYEMFIGGHRSQRVTLAVAFITAAVLALSSSASALTFGLNWDGNHHPQAELLESVQKSGASVYHVPLQYNAGGSWHDNDVLVEEAWKRGITILPTLESSSNRYLLPSSPEWATWGAWVQEVVERYGVNGEFWWGKSNPTPITAWEVWNEPNLVENNPQLPAGTAKAECKALGQTYYEKLNNCIQPSHYAAFLTYTAGKIQAVSNSRTGHRTDVLFGGLITQVGEDWGEFLAKANSAGGLPADVTGVAFHPYAFEKGAIGTIEDIENLRNELNNKLGAGGKSIWITELGWPVAGETPVGGTSSESQQWGRLTESFDWIKANAAGDNIQVAAWYNIRDFGGPTWAGHSGLQREDGSYRPAWQAFTELTGSAPATETLGPTGLGSFQVTLNGNVDPNGGGTSYRFQWGPTTAYGHETQAFGAGSDHAITAMHETLWNLPPNETYHYRIVATSSFGTAVGADQSFTTRPTASFPDAKHGNSISYWSVDPTAGWVPTSLSGDAVAAGSNTVEFNYEEEPHIVFVDAGRENRLTDWHFVANVGWVESPTGSDPVADGSSPEVIMVNGKPQVYFVDANGNTLSMTGWTGTGWQQTRFYGDEIANGTSPSPVNFGGTLQIYYVDAAKANTISLWSWGPGVLGQTFLWGDPVAAGDSPHALVRGTTVQIYSVDAAASDNVAVWNWGSTLTHNVLAGDPVAPNSDIALLDKGAETQVYFVDPAKGNSIALWEWNATEIKQRFLYGHPAAAGSSPSDVFNNNQALVFFADATVGNDVTAWEWGTSGINQNQLFGDPVATGSSPATQ